MGVWKGSKGLIENPPADVVLKRIAWAQLSTIAMFQYLENAVYLASKGVFAWDAKKQTKYWLWSCRFWAAYVLLDFYKLSYQAKTAKGKEKDAEVDERWWKGLIVNLAYAPLTIHWSLESGLIGEFAVGVLGSIAGIADLRDVWKKTAE
jgi:hypothetical protein